MKNPRILLYGGGGHGKVIMDIIRSQFGDSVIIGVIDDDPAKKDTMFYGHKIIGPFSEVKDDVDALFSIAIGDNEIRAQKAEHLTKLNKSFITVIHSSAIVASSAKIGEGTVVMPGVIINADAIIGKHCIINTGAVIEHDCVVENFTHIAPNTVLTGGVKVGRLTMLGSNSVVVPYKKVGDNCLVGAGSVVTRDIPDNALVRGNPARIIKVKRNVNKTIS